MRIEENKDNKEDLNEIRAHLKQEIDKRIQLENELNIALDELNLSNTEYLFAIKKLEGYKDSLNTAYNRAEFYKDLCSHDINNILQNILSGMQLCKINLDDPHEIKSIIKIVIDQVMRGSNLISNIRKLSQIEGTKISFKRIEIRNILKKSVDYIKQSYIDKKIKIKVDSVSEQLYIQANELISDVFENILINAIKHNKSAILEIEVMISREQKLGVNYLRFEFKDNGLGIRDPRKENIFQRGYSKNKTAQGMGLGLSLVKKIIENYKGEIWVEDRVIGDFSKGSNFVLLIPEVN